MKKNNGFTLIEMLVVIAIVAVLVSVIIPVVGQSTKKAEAAADAANLRNVMGQLNGILAYANEMNAQEAQELQSPESNSYPGAKLLVVYSHPGFIDAYYMLDGNYYGLKYFADIAQSGTSSYPTTQPTGDNYEWYEAGVGVFNS